MKRIIADMQHNGIGWVWTFSNDEYTIYGTNDTGYGLFRRDLILSSERQLKGLKDFSLPADEKAARRKILKWYHEHN